jgi:hypothetical protein
MPAYLGREPWHSGAFEQYEDARHGSRLTPVGGGLLSHDLDSDAWIEVELVRQELVRMYRDNVVRLQRRLWKIAQVEGNKYLGICPHGCCKDVPVFRVVGHPTEQRLETVHQSVRERPGHVRDTAIYTFRLDTSLDQVAAQLG